MFVLPMHLDEMLPEALQQRNRRRPVVDERAMPTRSLKLSTNDDLVLVTETEPGLFENQRRRSAWIDVKHCLDDRRPAVGSNDVRLCTGAPHQQDCVDQDGFPGAGLSGQNIEAGRKSDVDRLDDREVFDSKLSKHAPSMLWDSGTSAQEVSAQIQPRLRRHHANRLAFTPFEL